MKWTNRCVDKSLLSVHHDFTYLTRLWQLHQLNIIWHIRQSFFALIHGKFSNKALANAGLGRILQCMWRSDSRQTSWYTGQQESLDRVWDEGVSKVSQRV